MSTAFFTVGRLEMKISFHGGSNKENHLHILPRMTSSADNQ
jgi:hypothetical protein